MAGEEKMQRIKRISLIVLIILSSCKFKENTVTSSTAGTGDITIKVVSPNGGESIADGSNYPIQWTGTGTLLVRIFYSTDNGASWTLIKDSLSNVGIFNWQPVPNTISNLCKVRVTSVDGRSSDDSDADFAIVRNVVKSLTVTSPVGGETWEAGTAKQITWYSSGIDSVKIEYTTDNGQNWNFIAVDKKNLGIYYWQVIPNTPTTLAKVRISDAKTSDNVAPALSPNTFQILPVNTIKIIAPKAGVSWYAGSSDNILWQATNISNVKIEFTTNSGGSWSTITASTPNTGVYSWSPIPNVSSLQCKLRISNTVNGVPSVVSDSNFTITSVGSKLISVTSPNGGEKWIAGSTQSITWSATGIANVKIEYTVDNGISWNTITASTPSTGFYTWTQVPNLPSTNCKIRISDAQTGSPSDDSDNFFTISPAPVIKVVAPDGGEVWISGTQQTIQYTSQNVANVKIEFTTDGGASWTTLISSTPSIGAYLWSSIPNVISYQCKVRISDALFGSPVAISDNNFTISNQTQPLQTIKVLSPNGGEEWFAGSSDNIKWQSGNIVNVKIEYTLNGGGSWNTIVASTPSTGVYSWNSIPNVSSLQCLVRISNADASAPSDVSDANFTITNPGTKLIRVTAPNGGESWSVGTSQKITWSAAGISNVKIEYTINNGISWNTIIASTPSTGNYIWSQIPNSPSTNCKVRITDADSGSPSDDSDNFFTIASAPLIVVVSPNGGETLLSGSIKTIQYTSQNVPNVKIEYTINGGANWITIAASTPSVGTYDWTVPNINSSQCKVRVSDALFGDPSAISTNNFTITNVVTIPKSIKVLSPNGGENWQAGTSQNITWSSTSISKVKVELSTDKGATWSTLVDSVGGGAYQWSIAASLNSTQCLIRCSDATDKTYSDVSDSPFIISPRKWLNVTGPATGIYYSNQPITITWQSGGITKVGIKYTTTNGVADAYNPAFTILADSVGASLGSYTTYFSKPSNQYFVVIYNDDYGSNQQPSNNSPGFTIVQATPPSITLSQPSGGEQMITTQPGTPITDNLHYHPYQIKWTSTGITKVKLEWTTNGGGNWYTIPGADSINSTGTYVWVPGLLEQSKGIPRPDSSDNSLVRISNLSGTVTSQSPAAFSIHGSKKIQIVAPNATDNDFYKADTSHATDIHWPMLILWNTYAVSNVNIYYSLDKGVTWTTLATNYQSTGAYGWDFAFGAQADHRVSSQGLIKIQDAVDNTVWDVNGVPFYLNVKIGGEVVPFQPRYKGRSTR